MNKIAEGQIVEKRCRLCFAFGIRVALRLPHSPRNISRLLQAHEIKLDSSVDIEVHSCPECGFVQLEPILRTDFYDDYLMGTSHSPQMQEYQQFQAKDFVERFGLTGKRIIEIGSGDANYLEHLRAAGAQVFGIEPSAKFRQAAKPRNFTIFPGYVGCNELIPGGPYDGFVTRQVLEHVANPHDFLIGIRQSLIPGSYGLVEVPSLEQALEYGRFYDFFADHVNYFCARTLRFVLERNGFDVLDVNRDMGGEYLVALVHYPLHTSFTKLQQTVDILSDDLKQFIRVNRKSGKRVAVWGSGGKGITMMAVAGISDISYVIDSDPHKQGLYTPVSHFPVVAPEKLLEEPVDIVILTALAFKDEILESLRGQLGFQGQIAILGPRLMVLN